MRLWLSLLSLAGLLLWSNCGNPARPSPEAVYRNARLQIRLGNLKEALAQAESAYREWRDRPESKYHWQFRILKAEVLLAQGKAKEALPLLAGKLPEGPDFRELAARRLLSQGYARFLLAEYAEARRVLEEASRLAAECGSPVLLAEIELRKGTALTRLGDITAAQLCFRTALRMATQQRDLYLEAAASGNLGFSLLHSSRYDEAALWFERTLALSEKSGARRFIAIALGNLGLCYHKLGDFDKAVELLSRAQSVAGEVGDSYGQQIWLGDLGESHYQRGDFTTAVSCFQKALELSRRLGENYSTIQWLNSLAKTSADAGDWRSAEKYSQEALALSRQVGIPEAQVWTLLRSAQIAMLRRDFAAAEKGYREVLRAAQDAQQSVAGLEARAGLGNLYAQTGQGRKAEVEFQRALSGAEKTRTALVRDEWKLSFHSSAIGFYQDYVEFLMSRGQSERALEVAESCRARLLAQKLGLEQPALPLAGAASYREAARTSKTILLSFWLAPRRSFLWVVTPQTVESFVLPSEAEFRPVVEAYKGAIQNLRDPIETGNPAGRRLSALLLAPLAKLIPPGARLIVAPDGCLHGLNLETLPVAGERPHYWLEDVTIAVVPSLAMLATGAQDRRGASDSLLLIGNPVPPGSQFPPLPDVERELEGIRQRFAHSPQLTITGAAAHPGAYREANPGQFSLIHFSAHATANRESPLDSAVILSRKDQTCKLYAREVVGIPLQARLVTISACRGAGARLYAGEGLVGFAWAFLQAGARNVVAGLWDVNDRSTAQLMVGLYARLSENSGVAEALRSAKLALIRSPGPYRKPYYWAPFQVFTRSPDF